MKQPEPVLASSNFYFDCEDIPVAVQRVLAADAPSHPHDFTTIPHRHDFAELVIVASGSGIQVIDRESYAVSAGDVFLIGGETAHHFVKRGAFALVNVQFSGDRLPLPVNWLRNLPGYNVLFELEPSVRTPETFKHRLTLDPRALADVLQGAEALRNELEMRRAGYQAAAFELLLKLIIFLSRTYRPHAETASVPVFTVAAAISLMEKNFMKKIPLATLARTGGMSVNSFLRNFRQCTGASPIQYLDQLRLGHAATMLRTDNRSITEIAGACGFADSNYFSRKFHDRYGMSPRTYRDRRADVFRPVHALPGDRGTSGRNPGF